jgi:DNA-binding protein YbaB
MVTKLRNFVALIGCLVLVFFAGKHQARMEIQEEVTRIETQMQTAADEAADKLQKEKQSAKSKIDQLRADVASGAVRLSVRASCSATSATGDSEARAELDGETAQNLVSIAADGDEAILELNACIDFYNKIKEIK